MPAARRPLAGRTIVVTRATEQAGDLARRLRAAGARVIEAPAIAIAPPRSWSAADRALRRLDRFDLVLFTSVNAVERFARRARGRAARGALTGRPAVAIGPATAAAARRAGFAVQGVPRAFRAEGLARLLAGRRLAGARILMPRAAQGRDVVLRALRRRRARVTLVPVYRTVPARRGRAAVRRALAAGRVDLVTFASAATARHFAAAFGKAERRRLRRVPVAVIGPITAREARRLGFRIAAMPARATIPDLARAAARALRQRPSHAVVQ